jgi:acyl-CoA synthetase (AMP-forming)/AMP-acid ligase II
VIIMPQGIDAMTSFVGSMMLGAVPALVAYPNFKIEPAKYRAGLVGVTSSLNAKIVVIDNDFPDDLLECVALGEGTTLVRAKGRCEYDGEVLGPCHAAAGEEIAFIQHSAGTTGLQKGVALTHAAVLRQLGHLERALKIDGRSDRIYSWLPLYHDMGLIACFMLPIVCHVHVVTQSPLDWVMRPETMLQLISDYKCTLAWLPNFAFQFIPRRVRKHQWAHCDLSSVRALINCSEPVRSTSMDEFRNAATASGLTPYSLQTCYAMAENVFAVTQSEIGRLKSPSRISVEGQQFRSSHIVVPTANETAGTLTFTSSGKLLPDHEIRIMSSSGEVLSSGCVGEILVESNCLFEGYFNRQDLTAEVLREGWYSTGDLGFLFDDELYVVGRKKDLLIVGGENICPQDIEEIVSRHPAVHTGRAIATGIYNPDLGTEDIVVVAELEHSMHLAAADNIEREIRSQVVAGMGVAVRRIYLKPPKWIVKSTAGKPARSATRDKLLQEHPELNTEFKGSRVI